MFWDIVRIIFGYFFFKKKVLHLVCEGGWVSLTELSFLPSFLPLWNAVAHAHCLQFWSLFLCSFCRQNIWDLLPCTPQFHYFTRNEIETSFALMYQQPWRFQAVFQNSSVLICRLRKEHVDTIDCPASSWTKSGLVLQGFRWPHSVISCLFWEPTSDF